MANYTIDHIELRFFINFSFEKILAKYGVEKFYSEVFSSTYLQISIMPDHPYSVCPVICFGYSPPIDEKKSTLKLDPFYIPGTFPPPTKVTETLKAYEGIAKLILADEGGELNLITLLRFGLDYFHKRAQYLKENEYLS